LSEVSSIKPPGGLPLVSSFEAFQIVTIPDCMTLDKFSFATMYPIQIGSIHAKPHFSMVKLFPTAELVFHLNSTLNIKIPGS
jgi:hypothetical protein